MSKYIYQYKKWTDFCWNEQKINALFGEVKLLQGELRGQIQLIGFSSKAEKTLETLTLDVLKSSAIEGEYLNYEQVRSSIARRLGINVAGLAASARNVEGVVEMMLDATQNFAKPLTKERLFSWHAALFPTGYSGLQKIEVAKFRTGEMQIVSGALGHEKVHYEALPYKKVEKEMDKFLLWLNSDNNQIDNVLKSAIAHLWFIIIHPFDDGNGRIARAISDYLLARSENSCQRFYSLSNQIHTEKKQYYECLQKVQHCEKDITIWLIWFLNCFKNALLETEKSLQKIVEKAKFWEENKYVQINERQRFMLNKLFDDFFGSLTSSKWAKMTKSSQDTAIRDIKDLIEKGILQQSEAGGRSTNYELKKK
ncbi:MAG: Fic family protein [Bacteroidales bacterium]|jgi:Fic family protein|nr:Fic family protein [Bacteroidales bacterium]